MSVLLGQQDATFASQVDYDVSANALALGDVDRDGCLDVVTAGDDAISKSC